MLFSREQAEISWTFAAFGRKHLLDTAADTLFDGPIIDLRTSDAGALSFSMLPAMDNRLTATGPLQKNEMEGVFAP